MSVHPDGLAWSRSEDPIEVRLDGVPDFTHYSDERLHTERDSQIDQLRELTMHGSPAVDALRASIEREVNYMTDELKRRARAKHPSSFRADSLRPLRSLSWPPPTGHRGAR
jgi:hypothetical protein